MVISPVHWLVFLGCSYLLIQDIGPGLSLYTVGAQGKIGPHRGYFGHFICFKGILVTFRFRWYFCHFIGIGSISIIFRFKGILVIFRFRWYFGHFIGFGGISVIF